MIGDAEDSIIIIIIMIAYSRSSSSILDCDDRILIRLRLCRYVFFDFFECGAVVEKAAHKPNDDMYR